MIVFVDFETRSLADLKRIGGRRYVEHPSTEVICAVLGCAGENYRMPWVLGDPPPFDRAPDVAVANNAMRFDRFVWSKLGWPEPTLWQDTAIMGRRAGLRGSLDALSQRLLGRTKDHEGSALTRSLSARRKAGRTIAQCHKDVPREMRPALRAYHRELKATWPLAWPQIPDGILARAISYCDSDVEELAAIYYALAPVWADVEPDVDAADMAINDRGIRFDSALARRLLALDANAAEDACAVAGTVREVVSSNQKFLAEMRARGEPIPNAQFATVKTVADTSVYPRARALANARLAGATIAAGKLEAGLARVSDDGRLRDLVRNYGAHTGRWAGQGFQPHNIPWIDRRTGQKPPDDAAIDALVVRAYDEATRSISAAEMNVALRACLCAEDGARLVCCDFSQIEMRENAWAAGDSDAVLAFDEHDAGRGPDVYVRLASTIFAVDANAVTKNQRDTGKKGELGCGFGMGAHKFAETAERGGLDWATCPVTPEYVVSVWRDLHAPIVRFWYDLEDACKRVCTGGAPEDVGPYQVGCVDGATWIMLPSRRPIVYPAMRLVRGKRGPSLCYTSAKGPAEHTWGGKLTENVTQATCRDLLARSLVAAEREGLPVVLHVHDEIIVEVPEELADVAEATLREIMLDLPDWAAGLPVAVDSFYSRRYRK